MNAHIRTAILIPALMTSLIQPTLASGTGERSGGSRGSSSSYRQSPPVNYRPSSTPSRGSSPSNAWNRQPQRNAWGGNNSPNGPYYGNNPNHFSKPWSKNPSKNQPGSSWKKYAGWGKWRNSRQHGFGWGWNSWLDPSCSWPWYDAVPVADYQDPYTDCSGSVIDGINYSVPISQMPADTVNADDSDSYAAARTAYWQGDLDQALSAIAQACGRMPHNRDLHQFHSLVLFAMKDYCKSAAVAYAVLEDGPGWNWDTLQGFYPSSDLYTNQLRSLEQFVTATPSDANVRFLLAYHYLMLDHAAPARRQLAQVVALRASDRLAAGILGGLGDVPAATPVATADNEQTPGRNPMPISQETNSQEINQVNADQTIVESPSTPRITGTWKANPEKKVQIDLDLREDGRFRWTFIANGRPKAFSGKYQLNGTTLALSRDGDSDPMEGIVERIGDTSFRFRMKDSEADESLLTFTR